MEIQLVIDWLSFVGAWLLVAGPIYQAALELQDEDLEEDRIRDATASVVKPSRISAWWWVMPPVKLILERRRNQKYVDSFFDVLHPEDVEALVAFRNKATGWVFIGAGGLLIATKETFELVEHYEVHLPLFILIILAMFFLSIYNTIHRVRKSEKIITSKKQPAA